MTIEQLEVQMDDWIPLLVLPNLQIQGTFECQNIMALVPFTDPRVETLIKAHPYFKTFLSKFRDAFGVQIWPSVLVLRSSAPDSYRRADAVASFRDLISVCAIARSRAAGLVYDHATVMYSDVFDIYPWMVNASYDGLFASTPALQAVHIVDRFRGQTSPNVPVQSISERDLDYPLMVALLERWRGRYSGRRVRWSDRALFRSLNMANEAARSPGGILTVYYDAGRSIGLWVAAFETLSHPLKGQANIDTVLPLLEQAEWLDHTLAYRLYRVGNKSKSKSKIKSKPNPRWRNLACSIYATLYGVRNDFLHGNPVSSSRLLHPRSKKPLLNYAACLYRLALSSYLPLPSRKPSDPSESYMDYFVRAGRLHEPQRMLEKALKRGIRK
jgi:hypothetical protein